ncbi:hypothetical protein [Paremcibacter congregatus]|uniref:hypothetical protein n=1 Tax=Paremcibacter congregatus TaxID=2043170 RepID=UPI003A94A0B4
MKQALVISFIFHTVVIFSTMVVMPVLRRDPPTEMKVIPVEMVKIGDVTRLKSQEKKPDPAPKKKTPPKEKQPERKVEMPPEPPKMASTMPLPDMKAKPKSKPKKKPEKKVEPKKPTQTAANRVPKVTPKSKPRRFSSDKLAALLDKREETQPNIVEKLKDKDFGKQKIISDVDIQQQTLSIIDAVDKHIYDKQCWNIPAGAKGAEDLRVVIRLRLSPEGALVGAPKVTDSARMSRAGQEFFRTAAESALRAVRKCAPYDFLPRDQYNLWREMEIVFDPAHMLNG